MPRNFTQHKQNEKFLKLLKKGDKKTFAQLFDNYSQVFFNIILKKVSDTNTAEEILQDSFVTIYNKVTDFDVRKESLFIWMYKIVQEISLSTLNTNLKESKDKIKKVFDENNQSILYLIYFYGYNSKEIAQALNISENNIQKMIHRELKQFSKTKQEHG